MGPQHAPTYADYRTGVAATDTIANVEKAHGINMEGHDKALVQVIPDGGANPSVTIYWWSEELGLFIQENPTLTKAGVGVDTPYEFVVDCLGRIMFVAVTTLAAGSVKIKVAGYGLNDR